MDKRSDTPDIESDTSVNKVIEGQYCIGCGVCAAVEDSNCQIKMNVKGQYEAYTPYVDSVSDKPIGLVCPFSERAKSEDEIAQSLFSFDAVYHSQIGYYLNCFVGYVSVGKFRQLGSSGGVAKWVLHELLIRDKVDAIVHVAPNSSPEGDEVLYHYTVCHTPGEVLKGSKSVYYPVELSEALTHIWNNDARYAITGVPCFIKAIRLLSMKEPAFKERILYTIGLICGHLKSKAYAEMIGWQLGVPPGKLTYIDFRKKIPGKKANQKGVEVKTDLSIFPRGPEVVQNLFGANYSHGFFQYHACNFCDDVVAETADISVGDAWLPEYIPDGQGTSLVIVRQKEVARLIENAICEKRLVLNPLSPERIVESQAGGFRQRREGLAYRLRLMEKEGRWYPPKRLKPKSFHLNRKRKQIYDLRMEMTSRSHELFKEAKEAGEFKIFQDGMQPLIDEYQRLYRPTFGHRVKRAILRRSHRWLGWPEQL